MAVEINDEVSKRIHALRFLLIVFVVFIHGVINEGVNFAGGTEVFDTPLYVVKVWELTGAFTCVAVPLFFLISSFLLYSKGPRFMANLKKKSRTILLPYILWNALAVLFFFTAQSIPWTKPYFATYIIRNFSLWDWLGVFAGHFGQFNEGLATPLVYQFWFLRDLFILNLLFAVIKKVIDAFPAGAFLLFFILWIGGVNIYLVNTGALFFFALGYYVVKYRLDYHCLDNIRTRDISLMYAISIITGLFFADKMPLTSNINIIVGILFFLKLSHWFVNRERIYQPLLWLEGYAFFVYATHGIFLAVLIKLSVKIMPMHGLWLLAHYFGVTLLCIALLVGAGAVFKRLLPKPFAVLTGGR
ncbi:MAG: acyltransferase [Treponematales bacterium]